MNVSPNFTLEQFARSETAARMGREIVVPQEYVPNVIRLATELLEPLQAALQTRLVVLSGYRPPWLNAAVGGAEKSEHLEGRAADVMAAGWPPEAVAAEFLRLGLDFDKCIFEFGSWVHLGVAPAGRPGSKQVLTALSIAGRTQYLAGIVQTVSREEPA